MKQQASIKLNNFGSFFDQIIVKLLIVLTEEVPTKRALELFKGFDFLLNQKLVMPSPCKY